MKTLKGISARLKIAKDRLNNSNTRNKKLNTTYLGTAFKISTEFVAAVVVGSTIGFILDSLFDTKPWLIIFFFYYWSSCGNKKYCKNCKNDARKIVGET